MAKAFVLHKNNLDEHYPNLLLKFLKEGAQKNEKNSNFH